MRAVSDYRWANEQVEKVTKQRRPQGRRGEGLGMSAESLTPSRQCQHCKAWVWLPNWWTHNRKCELANRLS
jgi:hypothetical protein